MKIAYLVHDLADPAVARRVATLTRAGADIDLYGFRRTETAPATVAGVDATDLGQTRDGRLAQRAVSVLARRQDVGRWARRIAQAELVMGRNLEMLVLAAAARRKFAPAAPLVYELLDIHSAMLGQRAPSRVLRAVEAALLRRSAAVLVSSQAFDRNYLSYHHPSRPKVLLAENKVSGAAPPSAVERPAGPPWRLGWFGIIRCRRSLVLLAELARRHPGLIEIDIRGKLAEAALGDSLELLTSTPGLRYYGPYDYFTDLPAIYGRVHFVWAIDFYEAGANSAWLLPNRLYEGGLHGTVPIALKSVETGRWLAERDLGLTLGEPVEQAAETLFTGMTEAAYRASAAAIAAAGVEPFLWQEADDRALMAALSALR